MTEALDPDKDIKDRMRLVATIATFITVMILVTLAGAWLMRPQLEETQAITKQNCIVCLSNNSMSWEGMTNSPLEMEKVRNVCPVCSPSTIVEQQINCYGGRCVK